MERASMQIQVKSVIESQGIKNQHSVVRSGRTTSNQESWLSNLGNKVTEETDRVLIPPVYSLKGIRAYDGLQKSL
jgi:hypothetical protein